MNSLALISNIFSGDGLIIFLILLLLFGAKRLPELAKGLGSAVREFSKAKDEIEHEITRPASAPTPRIEPARDAEPHISSSVHESQATPQEQHVSTPQGPAPTQVV